MRQSPERKGIELPWEIRTRQSTGCCSSTSRQDRARMQYCKERSACSGPRVRAIRERSTLSQAACSSLRWAKRDRKSTRLNSSHLVISYAVFCLKKKKQRTMTRAEKCPSTCLLTIYPVELSTYLS